MPDKFTRKELSQASKLALKGLILPSGARLVALRALSKSFTPLLSKATESQLIYAEGIIKNLKGGLNVKKKKGIRR